MNRKQNNFLIKFRDDLRTTVWEFNEFEINYITGLWETYKVSGWTKKLLEKDFNTSEILDIIQLAFEYKLILDVDFDKFPGVDDGDEQNE